MNASEIRRVKIPAEADINMFDLARLIFEALNEVAAQLAELNERENQHEAELQRILKVSRGGSC
jgi:hypothetical protein